LSNSHDATFFISKTLPCFRPTFTNRTTGHCLGTFLAVNVFPPVTATLVPSLSVLQGRALAQAVGLRPLTADARVRFLHPHLHLTTANTRRKKMLHFLLRELKNLQFRNPSLFVKWVSVFYYVNHFIVYTPLYLTIYYVKLYAVCVCTFAVQATF